MRQKAGEKKNWIGRTACVLLAMVLISTRLVCGLYARYTVNGSGEDSARAAAFVFVTQDGADSRYLDLSNIKKPGDSQSYTFRVSNHNGHSVSETAVSYDFAVELNGNMPIKCTISDKDNKKVLETEVLRSSPVIKAQVSVGTFESSVESDHTYTITIQWPETENDPGFASRNAVSEAVLTVTAQQVD